MYTKFNSIRYNLIFLSEWILSNNVKCGFKIMRGLLFNKNRFNSLAFIFKKFILFLSYEKEKPTFSVKRAKFQQNHPQHAFQKV